MNGAVAGDGAVRLGSEIEIIEPVAEEFGATKGDDQSLVFGVDAEPAEMLVGFSAAGHGLYRSAGGFAVIGDGPMSGMCEHPLQGFALPRGGHCPPRLE